MIFNDLIGKCFDFLSSSYSKSETILQGFHRHQPLKLTLSVPATFGKPLSFGHMK